MTPSGVAKPQQLIGSLESLCEEWLRPHLDRLKNRSVLPREKVFNDGLWRTIRLYAWEVAVLDTYLVQRLREIRQLGVIHWVYPTATHTRFEHSLGVLRQVQALIDGVERNSASAHAPLISERLRYLLRLAALLHDCGHTIMSHVSEPFVVKLPQMRELIDWTEQEYKTWKKPSASEAIAAVFVTSPAFADLIGQRAVGADFVREPLTECRTIAELIVGGRLTKEPAWVVFLLNGAFDADKLDYMPRDCMMAGVPCSVDIERVIEKVHILQLPRRVLAAEVPDYVEWLDRSPGAASPGANDDEERIAVLALSGSGALIREFAEMRTVLFDKVYHHQKVRGIELMARRLFEQLQYDTVREWLKLTDNEILNLGNPMSRFLRERYFFKRVFAKAVRLKRKAAAGNIWWSQFRADAGGALQDKIGNISRRAAAILKDDCPGALAAVDDFGIGVDILDESRLTLDGFPFSGNSEADFQSHMGLSRSDDGDRRFSFKVRVYAAEPALVPAFFGAQTILRHDYKPMRVRSGTHGELRRGSREMSEYDRRLQKSGLYADFGRVRILAGGDSESGGYEAAALEKFLKAAWSRIVERAVNFGRYQSANTDAISPAFIAAFLRQFGSVRLARPALRLLERIDLMDRKFFVARLTDELIKIRATGVPVAYVSPLGATGDSSALVSYFMNDVTDCRRPDVVPLEMALEKADPDDTIVLWDDFCATGRHTLNVLSQWMGWPSPAETTKDLVRPLSRKDRALFRKRNIRICYGIALHDGPSAVRKYLQDQGLGNTSVITPTEEKAAKDRELFDSEAIGDRREREELEEFLRNKAREIYRRKKPDLAETERENLLLGYGNRAHRLVFYYNVPKVTITCLWEESDDPPWKPLFRRRSKPSLEKIARKRRSPPG